MDQPIACSLDADGARSQLDQWRGVLAASVESIEREDSSTLRLRLHPGADTAVLTALARREIACCPFFRFGIEIDVDGMFFVASVPADATTILDGFADLAHS
jgi:hypothetical protein